jgi:SNF2 family DNA or RNA helicase
MMFSATTDLMMHQREAVAKLLPTRVGALFMDMGTGKTRAAIELARVRQQKISRVVWVCPVSVKKTIAAEIIKHTTTADVHVFDARTTDKTLPDVFWHVVGVESVGQSSRVTLAINALVDENTMLVVDESTYIKHVRAKRTQRLTAIGERARYRLILTGTPTTQGIEDLYAQMTFLSPRILGYRSWWKFKHNHLEYSDRHKGLIVTRHNIPWLAAKISPYIYQVRRQDCVDLPEKTYSERIVPLTEEQYSAYEEAKLKLIETPLDNWDSSSALKLFTNLQTVVCGFINSKTHCRILADNRVEETLYALSRVPGGEKVVIWARFRRPIYVLKQAISARYGPHDVAEMHGGIPERNRGAELARWRSSARVLLATQPTGGHGIDLTAATTVIFHADGYKYAERIQAEDRTHRIGQGKKVHYITIRTDTGIDQRIADALERKENAFVSFRNEVENVKGQGRESAHKLIKYL